ncbi:hypothetical protein MHN00_10755 [Alteromonas sp. Cnat2-8]|uniref:hypothetical protein n=1 Tax=Alteromonas sp. Cnat2-8 TaxID=2917728 RepID=UPI001EF4BA7A|nr:hypothetical protein [Alteromonas sp. Cnat2-8]MCG7654040.1 hypothetical protein [Alteromonas sp. Cnat2-8]
MRKQVWIHLGPPKTGTSAIQKWMVANRAWLGTQGIMYPEYEVGANGISSGHIHLLLSESNGKFKVDPAKVKSVYKQFEESPYRILLLSSEYFFYHAESLAALLPKVKFIAYVRCPIETFESVYNQSVKRHGKTEPLSFSKNLHTTTLDRLSELATNIKNGKVYFRAYLQSNENFNLVSDFLSVLKLECIVDNENTNASYTFEALETKRWLNKFKLDSLNDEIDSALQALSEGTRNYTLLPEDRKERHFKQCVQNLKLFHTKFHIKNANILFNSLSKRESWHQMSQDNQRGAINFISARLFELHPKLYQRVSSQLKKLPSDNSDKVLIKEFSRFHNIRNILLLPAFNLYKSKASMLLKKVLPRYE